MLSKILLLTATEIETQNVLGVFSEGLNKKWVKDYRTDIQRLCYLMKDIPEVEIVLVQSEAGTSTLGGSQSTVTKSIMAFSPQTIIMIGIAFGLKPQKQKLGDLLVSHQLKAYDIGKVKGEFISRGDRVTISPGLLSRFRSGKLDWQGTKDKIATEFGLVVSGEKLVDDKDFRDWLLDNEPEAIGGEMEAVGLYVAAQEEKTDWIVVKGISDWGDGNKKDEDQDIAARNAASFVLHVIQNVGFGIRINEDSKQLENRSNQLHNTKPLQNNLHDASAIEHRKSLLDKIQIKFIRQLEKELIENMDEHFSDPKVALREQNYLAILYFSQEVDEIYRLSKEIKALYSQFSKSYLTDALESQLNSNLDNIKQHQELISEVIQAALSAEPNHYLGKCIQRSTDALSKAVMSIRIALLDKANKTNLNYSILELQQHTEVLLSYMQDVNAYLKQYLPSWVNM